MSDPVLSWTYDRLIRVIILPIFTVYHQKHPNADLVFGDDLEDVGGVLSTMELPLSDLVSQSAANLFESAVDLSIKLQIEKTLHMDYCQKLINYE